MIMLERYGMKAVISDPLDENLTAVAKGKRPEIVDLVHQAMDGTAADVSSLDKELADYVKTVKVIMGETLFSDSYLEI
jgi:5-methyltetrahydrofolate corrinoid/iron sulfur protein methyltransferase